MRCPGATGRRDPGRREPVTSQQNEGAPGAQTPATEDKRLPFGTVFSYSSLNLPAAALGLPITVYLPPFYAQEAGLGLATVGLVFTLARLWDVVTDPVMGMVVDRFSTRWGRYRHWIVGAAPVLMLATWFLYLPGPGQHSAAYLLGWLIVLYAAYTVVAIAHQSWGAELAHSYHERSRLYGWRELVGIAGMTIVLALPALMESTGSGDAYGKIGSMGWYLLLLLPITTWLIVTRVPDNVPATRGTTMDMKAVFRAISTNSALRRCLVADFSCALATGITGSTYIFLAVWVFEVPNHASLILLVYFMAGLAIVPLWMRLSYRYGKHNTLAMALLYASVMLLGFIFVAGPGNLTGLFIVTLAYGCAFGAAPMILRALIADVADMDELITGQKRAGLFFALLTSTNKVGGALSVSISYLVLGWIGFDPSLETNSPGAISGLLYTFAFLPSAFFALAMFALWRYPLDKTRHDRIRAELDAR